MPRLHHFHGVLWNKNALLVKPVRGRCLIREAAAVSGVNITKTLLIVYTLAGALYGFAGTLEAARRLCHQQHR